MKGDFSKLNFEASPPSDSVLMQQGRVQLDSDWNEQAYLLRRQREQLLQDLFGNSAVPRGQAGFGVIARGGLSFDGCGQYVHVVHAGGLSLWGDASFTIEVSFCAREGGRGGVLVSRFKASHSHHQHHHRRGEYLLALLEDGRLLFERTGRVVEGEILMEKTSEGGDEPESLDEGIEAVERQGAAAKVDLREVLLGVISTRPVAFGRTMQAAVVCRAHPGGSEITLYLDGHPAGHAESEFHGSRVKAPLWFGAEPDEHREPTRGFDGQLFEVRFWDTTRTAAKMRAGLNRRPRGAERHLLAAWRFNEGEGETASALAPAEFTGYLGGDDVAKRPAWQPRQLSLTPGRCYVEGLVCENGHESLLHEQPEFLESLSRCLTEEGEPFLLFLDAWQRPVTALEDPALYEVALGGPDTTTRLRTVWQVRLLPLDEADAWMEAQRHAPTLSARHQPTGYALENTLYRVEIHDPGQLRSSTWTEHGAVDVEALLRPSSQVRLEDWHAGAHRWAIGQHVEISPRIPPPVKDSMPASKLPAPVSASPPLPLFRVTALDESKRTLTLELLFGDWPAASELRLRAVASFKWSHDNGATALAIAMVEGNTLVTRAPAGLSAAFQPDDWVELADENSVLANRVWPLAQLDTVDDGDPSAGRLNLRPSPLNPAGKDLSKQSLVRRWDAPPGELKTGVCVPAAGVPVELEHGPVVTLDGAGYLRAGDYWVIPARAATEDIVWPAEAGMPVALPPLGIRHRYASLALIRHEDAQLLLDDLRHIFAPLGAQITTSQIRDRAVTPEKLSPEVWEEIKRMIVETTS